MSNKVFRCYVEKRPGFDVPTKAVQSELSETLKMPHITVRIFNRYDISGLPEDKWQYVINTVLSEPVSDIYYEETLPELPGDALKLYIEPLPGQFDMRADSCEQCIQMLLGGERPIVKTATVYAIGGISDAEFAKVKSYLINPLEYRETSDGKSAALSRNDGPTPDDVPTIEGFISMDDAALEALRTDLELAMSLADLKLFRDYFKSEGREPMLSELRVVDTYWSDHCRHTTFNTIIASTDIKDPRVSEAYDLFLKVNGEKPPTLMNIATAVTRHLRGRGMLPLYDLSEENNACTVHVKAEFEDGEEDWMLFFKNETHNHPTEIEPFGGASTCIGGAIRDPLSGRSYVYQAMRITGSGDPRMPIEDTLPGKLPQRKITVTAAQGFSSYGNQIGLATGLVKELYHPGYIAKRMEVGAVVGAAPKSYVRRERPAPGDIVVLLGGRTGRDGIGGATGSSKTHNIETVNERASEVQKGNAPEERKIQRLFRDPKVTKLIKRCNDFGAGGVSVAIGELADGLKINLDVVPVKYEGLNGTELAISESQERMAVVIAEQDKDELLRYAAAENIEATVVAEITEQSRLVMSWRGQTIVDIDRAFLDTNGAERFTNIYVPEAAAEPDEQKQVTADELMALCGDLNFCSQKGLLEHFDNSIGAASVFMPYGGKYSLTETQVMSALLPAKGVRTASVMSFGFDPYRTEADPFGGSAYAVVSSVAKLIASGVSLETVHLSLQEYFPRMGADPTRWGLPFASVLGAFAAQMGLGVAAIGGKDSMSGSYSINNSEDIDVPPTLVSFAVSVVKINNIITNEFKNTGSNVYLLKPFYSVFEKCDFNSLKEYFDTVEKIISDGNVLSAWAVGSGGTGEAIVKMCMGNRIGFNCETDLFSSYSFGGFVIEYKNGKTSLLNKNIIFEFLGSTSSEYILKTKSFEIPLDKIQERWERTLESVYPYLISQDGKTETFKYENNSQNQSHKKKTYTNKNSNVLFSSFFKNKKARFVIPVFPGTNSEYDTKRAIEKAGGEAHIIVIRNLSIADIAQSVYDFKIAVDKANAIVIPGGFSGGDEPDGSGKFITAFIRNPAVSDAVMELLQKRDGLICGICNGFQALIKLGLVPYGEIREMTETSPTLTFNTIGRHQSVLVNTKIVSNKSPWLSHLPVSSQYIVPVSHGEGRFIAEESIIRDLTANGQIATQYADFDGNASQDIRFNPNNSNFAIEGITSPCGKVFGRMAHNERFDDGLYKNIPDMKKMDIFKGAVNYFS